MPIKLVIHPRREKPAGYKPRGWRTGNETRLDYRTEQCRCIHGDRSGHTHPVRIPVGMSDEAWRAHLQRGLVGAKFAHARWAAKRIARWILTEGVKARWQGSAVDGHACSPGDLVEYVRQDLHIRGKLGLMAVPAPLLEHSYDMARRIVEGTLSVPEARA